MSRPMGQPETIIKEKHDLLKDSIGRLEDVAGMAESLLSQITGTPTEAKPESEQSGMRYLSDMLDISPRDIRDQADAIAETLSQIRKALFEVG